MVFITEIQDAGILIGSLRSLEGNYWSGDGNVTSLPKQFFKAN